MSRRRRPWIIQLRKTFVLQFPYQEFKWFDHNIWSLAVSAYFQIWSNHLTPIRKLDYRCFTYGTEVLRRLWWPICALVPEYTEGPLQLTMIFIWYWLCTPDSLQLLVKYQEELFPAESFEEFCDVMGELLQLCCIGFHAEHWYSLSSLPPPLSKNPV